MKIKKQLGFTIVELLIVIVVIGILASITIVAYNGVQARAYNVKETAAAKSYIQLLMLYKSETGAYPTDTGCLGNNNIDTNGDGSLDCNDNGDVTYSSALNTALATEGTLPDVVTRQITGDDGIKRGGIWYNASASPRPALVYFLQGAGEQCDIGISDDDIDRGNSGNALWCVVTLPE